MNSVDVPRRVRFTAAAAGLVVLVMGLGCDDPTVPERPDLGGGTDLDPIGLDDFTPPRGLAGDTLRVTGFGFSADPEANVLRIGGATATILEASETALTAVIPAYASSGVVSVSDRSGWRSASSTALFQLRAPDGLGQGFNGDAGEPVIDSTMPLSQVVDSTTTKIRITGTVTGASDGYWAIIDDGAWVRSQGRLIAAGGAYEQDVPLFCGGQRLVVFFRNDQGRSFYRTDVDRTNCTEAGIRVQLHWDTDQTDVDLHLVEPGGAYGSAETDCYFANCPGGTLDWGEAGAVGNPILDVDDVDGYGPENIYVTPTNAGDYAVTVHYYSDHGNGPSNAWVEMFFDGNRIGAFGPRAITNGSRWTVGTINWPTGTVVAAR